MIKSKMLKNRFSSSANISFTVVNYLNNLKVKPLKSKIDIYAQVCLQILYKLIVLLISIVSLC